MDKQLWEGWRGYKGDVVEPGDDCIRIIGNVTGGYPELWAELVTS